MKKILLFSVILLLVVAFRPERVETHAVVNTTVTFDREIVRILNKKCLACHSDNNLGVPLTTYEETRPWAGAIHEEVLRKHMPPWRAVTGYSEFANDGGLTNRELQFLVAWIDGNGPKTKDQGVVVNVEQGETNDKDRLKLDVGRWQLGKPDLMRPIPMNAVAPDSGDTVRRVVVDLGLNSERSIRALEFKPGDRRVVRAVFLSLEDTGQWLGSWTPWYGVTVLPKDMGYRVPAGSKMVAEIHYRSASVAVEDRGTLGVYFASKPVIAAPTEVVLESAPADGEEIDGAEKFSGSLKLQGDTSLLALKPDAQRGVESLVVSARKPDGLVQILLMVKEALPEWPTPYILKNPVRLPKGTELIVTERYRADATPRPTSLKTTLSVISSTPAVTTH